MNSKLVYELTVCETDINGAIKRFSGNEELYLSYLKFFVDEPTETLLGDAIKNREWDEAFTAAHALKGVAANLGLTPLFHALGELIIQLRTGKMAEILISYDEVNRCYEDVISALKKGKLVDEEKNYE